MIYHSTFLRIFGIKIILLFSVVASFILNGCTNTATKIADLQTAKPAETTLKVHDHRSPASVIKTSDSLLYQSPTFTSYVDNTKRGAGVVSFILNVQDRLDIWNMDDTKFGEIVLNEDLTYFTLNMPKKIIARKLIPEFDFAAFDFDAEKPDTNKEYVIIYVNKEKRKVRKSDLKFTFSPGH